MELAGGGSGSVDITASNGRVEIHNRRGPITVHTFNSQIHLALQAVEYDVEARTSNGSIFLLVDPDSAFDLSAQTSNAGVEIDLPKEWSGLSIGRTSFEGSYNGGGPEVTLRTSNSRILVGPGD